MIVVGCMQWAWASYPQIQQQWLLLSAVFPCCNAPQPMLPLWYVLVVNVCFCMPVFKQHQCWFAGQTQRAGESVLVLHTNGTDRSKWPHQRPSAGCHFRPIFPQGVMLDFFDNACQLVGKGAGVESGNVGCWCPTEQKSFNEQNLLLRVRKMILSFAISALRSQEYA